MNADDLARLLSQHPIPVDVDYDKLAGGSTGVIPPFPPTAICWPALTEEEETDHFDALDDWVAWLIDRYSLDHRTIPPCWDQHGALLEELSALRTGWVTAYCLTARGDLPLNWHLAFAAARERLSEWAAKTGCRPEEHREPSQRTP